MRGSQQSAQWEFDLPASHGQPLDAPGRPPAHRDFLRSHDALVGEIPNEAARWRRRHNYYLNCLRDVDRNIAAVLDELEASGQMDRTIILLTADHGDMDGSHQLHAKGAVAYREQNHVPLIVVHPDHAGGKQCAAITSHLDLAATPVGLTGTAPEKRACIANGLPGKDLSGLLSAPESADLNAVHPGVLFNYNMFAYIDGDYLNKAIDYVQKGGNPKALKEAGIVPDMKKRGAVRSVYDGRYVFARYFSPKQQKPAEEPRSVVPAQRRGAVRHRSGSARDDESRDGSGAQRRADPRHERQAQCPDRCRGGEGPWPDAAGRRGCGLGGHGEDDGALSQGCRQARSRTIQGVTSGGFRDPGLLLGP